MADRQLPGGDDPDLARLGHAFHDELRAEAEAYEVLAAKDLLRGRSLGDVAVELLHRGDRVSAVVGPATFAGEVVYSAGDLARVRTATGDVDLDLAAVSLLRVVERVRAGGRQRDDGARSFTARLHEHEAAGGTVELGGPLLGELVGTLDAVAADHVVVTDPAGVRCYVARRAVGWIRRLR